jgi:N-acetylneuraminic acid mutarotase
VRRALRLGPVRRSLLLAAVLVAALVAAFPAAGGESPGLWQGVPPPPTVRQEVSYVQLGGKLYLTGGAVAHEVFDPQTGKWSSAKDLPMKLDHIQGVALGGKIYYIGGLKSWPQPHVSTVYIYDPATNSFSEGGSMGARGRAAGGVAVHDGKIYYAGGLHNGSAVDWFDVYDPATGTWSALPSMPRKRDHFHAAVVDGRFYAIGGRDTAITATTPFNDIFDIATGKWSQGTPLPTPRGGFAAAALGREIFVIGGEGGDPNPATVEVEAYQTVEAYDTVTNTWRALAPMPTARHGIQVATCNGGLYIAAGGLTQGGAKPSNVHEVLFPNGTPTACTPANADEIPPGSPASPSGGTPAAAGSDRTPPVVREMRARARVGARRLRVRLNLTERATVRLVLRRAQAGRRVGGSCSPVTPSTRSRPRCIRYVTVGDGASRAVGAGWSTVYMRTPRLRARRHRLVVLATDAAGNRAPRERVGFDPLRRR